jgi:hypothetical protein
VGAKVVYSGVYQPRIKNFLFTRQSIFSEFDNQPFMLANHALWPRKSAPDGREGLFFPDILLIFIVSNL